jgi:hypothetical protein
MSKIIDPDDHGLLALCFAALCQHSLTCLWCSLAFGFLFNDVVLNISTYQYQ